MGLSPINNVGCLGDSGELAVMLYLCIGDDKKLLILCGLIWRVNLLGHVSRSGDEHFTFIFISH